MFSRRFILPGVALVGMWKFVGGATPAATSTHPDPPPSTVASTPTPATAPVSFALPEGAVIVGDEPTVREALSAGLLVRSTTTTSTAAPPPASTPPPDTAPPTTNGDQATLEAWRAEAVRRGLPGTDEVAMQLITEYMASITDPPSSSTVVATGADEYVVVKGDTLEEIANRFGVGVQALADANGIAKINELNEGQVLKVPAP